MGTLTEKKEKKKKKQQHTDSFRIWEAQSHQSTFCPLFRSSHSLYSNSLQTNSTQTHLGAQEVIGDLCCVLCNQGFETPCHLKLFDSLFASLKVDEHNVTSSEDIINIILNLPKSLCQAKNTLAHLS